MSDQERSTVPPLLNHFMSAVLRSPLHPMASRSVMLITFTGRKSGKTYAHELLRRAPWMVSGC